MQEHVRKERRDHPSLRRPFRGALHHPVLENSCLEPFVDQTSYDPVLYPLVEDFSEVTVMDRPEVVRDIQVKDPLPTAIEDVVSKPLQR